ncbi:hypothetical protein ABIA94_008681 [Bradyrhizobium sp. LA7.1]
MPPLLFGASREPVLNGIGSQRNREMLSPDNIHPRQAPCCQLTTTSSRGAVIWQESARPMSLCWSGSQLGSRRISHRAEARCGCFAACYLKEPLAFGTGRLVLWNSIRTVRREVDSPLDRVHPNVACDGPSLAPAMPRPCVRMRRTKRISSLAMDVASADCPKRAKSLPLQLSRARPVLCCLVVPGRGGEPGRLSGRGLERDWHPGPAVGGTRERGAAVERPRCKRRLSSVVNLGGFGDYGILIPTKTASNIRSPRAGRGMSSRSGPKRRQRVCPAAVQRRRGSPRFICDGSGIVSRRCRLFARPTWALKGPCR